METQADTIRIFSSGLYFSISDDFKTTRTYKDRVIHGSEGQDSFKTRPEGPTKMLFLGHKMFAWAQ